MLRVRPCVPFERPNTLANEAQKRQMSLLLNILLTTDFSVNQKVLTQITKKSIFTQLSAAVRKRFIRKIDQNGFGQIYQVSY